MSYRMRLVNRCCRLLLLLLLIGMAYGATESPAAPVPLITQGYMSCTLADGRVLVAGGIYQDPNLGNVESTSAYIYDASSDTWTQTGDLNIGRDDFSGIPPGRWARC